MQPPPHTTLHPDLHLPNGNSFFVSSTHHNRPLIHSLSRATEKSSTGIDPKGFFLLIAAIKGANINALSLSGRGSFEGVKWFC